MATGPDPNRFTTDDPETRPEGYRRGDSLGDLKSTRLGLPHWGVGALVIIIFVVFLILTR